MFGLLKKKIECVGCGQKLDSPKTKNPEKIIVRGKSINLHGEGKCPKCKTEIVLIDEKGKFESRIKLRFDAWIEFSKKEQDYNEGKISEEEYKKAEEKLDKVEDKVLNLEEKLMNKYKYDD